MQSNQEIHLSDDYDYDSSDITADIYRLVHSGDINEMITARNYVEGYSADNSSETDENIQEEVFIQGEDFLLGEVIVKSTKMILMMVKVLLLLGFGICVGLSSLNLYDT